MDNNCAQHSLGWYRARLGRITGSCVGKIIGKGRGAEFSKTGLEYLKSVAAELMLPPIVRDDDEFFSQYIEETSASSKAMRIGTEREPEARNLYIEITKQSVMESGAVVSDECGDFSSSPDGIVIDSDGVVEGVLEIKCPKPSTYMGYLADIKDAPSLLAEVPEYYWQCMSHMAVTGASWCDFIAYCPFNSRPLHIVRVDKDEEAIKSLMKRVKQGSEYIHQLVGNTNQQDKN